MKKLLFYFMAAAAFVTLAACDENGGDETEDPVVKDGTYKGTVTVDAGTENAFTFENASMEVTVSEDKTFADIKMAKVKFAEAMPPMDITIPGVIMEKAATGYSLSGNGIVPTAMGGEFPAFTINGLTGQITDLALSFDMLCGTYRVAFSGTAATE